MQDKDLEPPKTAEASPLGAYYRPLVCGELMEPTDEVYLYGTGPWEALATADPDLVGDPFHTGTYHAIRRPYSAPTAPASEPPEGAKGDLIDLDRYYEDEARTEAVRDENRLLKEALLKYGGHVRGPDICEMLKHSAYPCTCGFDAVMALASSRVSGRTSNG